MASVNTWAIFQFHDLRYYCLSRLSNVLANAAQNVAVGWFVYDLTHSDGPVHLSAHAGALADHRPIGRSI